MVLSYANAIIVEDACIDIPVTASAVVSGRLLDDPARSRRLYLALERLAAYAAQDRRASR